MKIEVYAEKKEPEKVLRLRLVEAGNSVRLHAVDENGGLLTMGLLLRIDSSGLHRYLRVNPRIGLSLDDSGRIKLNEGDE